MTNRKASDGKNSIGLIIRCSKIASLAKIKTYGFEGTTLTNQLTKKIKKHPQKRIKSILLPSHISRSTFRKRLILNPQDEKPSPGNLSMKNYIDEIFHFFHCFSPASIV